MPVIAEELMIEKRRVPTGGIRVHKLVQEHEETVAMLLAREHVDIRRVTIGRDVDSPMPIRYEGETTIIPVVEEVIVVQKRLRLKEEFHITRLRTEEHTTEKVILQREEAIVERLDEHGRATLEDVPQQKLSEAAPELHQTQQPPLKSRPVRRNRVIPEE